MEKHTAPTYGSRLAQARRWVGITQRDLANLIGVSRETISAWERGKGSPDVNHLVELADVLGRDPQWFVANLKVPAQAGARRSGCILWPSSDLEGFEGVPPPNGTGERRRAA
jgi:transcriptional regulator with XRE-family HTH domain